MKKIIITLLCLTVSTIVVKGQENSKQGVNTQTAPQADPDAGKFKFKEETHDYGEVPEGPLAEYDFEFKNTGKKPIIIQDAHGSCGCTVPTWPHEAIMPKQKAVIHVAYTTNGRPGPIMKDITINSNAQQSPMVLHIKGTVKPKQTAPVQLSSSTEGKL